MITLLALIELMINCITAFLLDAIKEEAFLPLLHPLSILSAI